MTNVIARTGRVQSWIDEPEWTLPRYPVLFVLKTEWKVPMESQQSNMQATVSDMEQELLSIYQSSTQTDMRGRQALLRLALYHLGEFFSVINDYPQRWKIKMEQSSSTRCKP